MTTRWWPESSVTVSASHDEPHECSARFLNRLSPRITYRAAKRQACLSSLNVNAWVGIGFSAGSVMTLGAFVSEFSFLAFVPAFTLFSLVRHLCAGIDPRIISRSCH